jgi:hypothetical protein
LEKIMSIDRFSSTELHFTRITTEFTVRHAANPVGTAAATPVHRCCPAAGGSAASFADALRTSLAELRTQNFGAVISLFAASGDSPKARTAAPIDALLAARGLAPAATTSGSPSPVGAFGGLPPAAGIAGISAPGGIAGLSPAGRNLALFDPESAYRMMTLINRKEVQYKAEFTRIGEMGSALAGLQQDGLRLAASDAAAQPAGIESSLADFVARYNTWVVAFDADMQPDGLFTGTQAARAARFALKQSIENPFFGAAQGIRGLRDLGVTIDPASGQAALDTARLANAFAANRDGALAALHEFGRSFARSAELLVSAGNFIDNRTQNLDRVIRHLAGQKPALQAEFGLGDPVSTAVGRRIPTPPA